MESMFESPNEIDAAQPFLPTPTPSVPALTPAPASQGQSLARSAGELVWVVDGQDVAFSAVDTPEAKKSWLDELAVIKREHLENDNSDEAENDPDTPGLMWV